MNEELYNLFEQFLIDNNVYSQFVTKLMERSNVTLKELVFNLQDFPILLICAHNFHAIYPNIYEKWRNILKNFKND